MWPIFKNVKNWKLKCRIFFPLSPLIHSWSKHQNTLFRILFSYLFLLHFLEKLSNCIHEWIKSLKYLLILCTVFSRFFRSDRAYSYHKWESLAQFKHFPQDKTFQICQQNSTSFGKQYFCWCLFIFNPPLKYRWCNTLHKRGAWV